MKRYFCFYYYDNVVADLFVETLDNLSVLFGINNLRITKENKRFLAKKSLYYNYNSEGNEIGFFHLCESIDEKKQC
jgi:hypothetical protein